MTATVAKLLFLLLPAVAWAQPAAGPAPPKPVIDRAEAFIRSDPALVDAILRSAAATMAGQTQQQVAASPAPPAAVVPPPTSSPTAPPPAVVGLNLPPELMPAIWTLVITIVVTATGAVAAWGKSHSDAMQHNKSMLEVGANQAIDNTQKALGARAELTLAKQGKSLIDVDESDPVIQSYAQTLRAGYPEWGPLVGLTQDVAARKVLSSAVEQSVKPLVAHPIIVPAAEVRKSEVVPVLRPVPDEPVAPPPAPGSIA